MKTVYAHTKNEWKGDWTLIGKTGSGETWQELMDRLGRGVLGLACFADLTESEISIAQEVIRDAEDLSSLEGSNLSLSAALENVTTIADCLGALMDELRTVGVFLSMLEHQRDSARYEAMRLALEVGGARAGAGAAGKEVKR